MKNAPATIDEYISGFDEEIRTILEKIRKTVSAAAPKAEEAIKYAMPTFVLNGNLIHFAAFKNHIGLYPAPTSDPSFTKKLAPFKTGRGSIQFPYNQPMPLALITEIVKARIEQMEIEKMAVGSRK